MLLPTILTFLSELAMDLLFKNGTFADLKMTRNETLYEVLSDNFLMVEGFT